jgi:A/G-specific adenine glycosylase
MVTPLAAKPLPLPATPAEQRAQLLAWYDQSARDLPWRVPPCPRNQARRPDPYHIWLSEIMLQQTTVAAVKGYFARFLASFPTVEDLARADQDQVLGLWSGLGYYARARNLHACARAVVALGGFPRDVKALQALPGIGPYTAAAIAAIAFDQPAVPVDGNVERVLSRLEAIKAELPAAKPVFWAAAEKYVHPHRPGDFAQALMDLGATVCTPKSPSCSACPWQAACRAFAAGQAQRYPVKAQKKVRPVRFGVSFVVVSADPKLEALSAQSSVWLQKRTDKGLLGGMLEPPGTQWRDTVWDQADVRVQSPLADADWIEAGTVEHVFTHFALRLQVLACRVAPTTINDLPQGVRAAPVEALDLLALPSVMRKVLKAGFTALETVRPS